MTTSRSISGQTPDPEKDYGWPKDGKPTDLTRWPAGAESDELEWGVTWSRNQRAVMAENDTAADQPANADEIEWAPIDLDFEAPNESTLDMLREKTGSYVEMSAIAVHLNQIQDRSGRRSFTFSPDLLARDLV